MKQSPQFANLDAIIQEKARLKKAIAGQETKLLRNFEQAKQNTKVMLSPARIAKNLLTQFFTWKSIKSNPLATFKIGYKIIGFLIKKIRS